MPVKLTAPSAMRPARSRIRITAQEVTDLPEPDSPTMPSVSPLATDILTCCTALTMPRRVENSTVRSLTSSSGCAVILGASAYAVHPLAPLLRGEGWGEGLLPRIPQRAECAESPPHPDRQRRSDLSPQAGRGEEDCSGLTFPPCSRPPLRIDDVAQSVAEQVEAKHRDHQRQARKQRDPPLARHHEGSAFGDHDAPFCRGGPHPKPDEREPGGIEDRIAHGQ